MNKLENIILITFTDPMMGLSYEQEPVYEKLAAQICVPVKADDFLNAFEDGRAEKAFREDLKLTGSLGIHSLPSCLIRYGKKTILVSGMMTYEGFISAIEGL